MANSKGEQQGVMLLIAAAVLVASTLWLSQGSGFSVVSAQYALTAGPGWQSAAAPGGEFRAVSLPYRGGDGLYRVVFKSDKPEAEWTVYTDGYVENLYINGEHIYSHNKTNERILYFPHRYRQAVNLRNPGNYLMAVEVSGTKGDPLFDVGPGPNQAAWILAVLSAAACAFFLLPKKRKDTVMRLFRSENRRLAALLLAVSFIYFISSAYITESNDGSHFALVSALVHDQSVVINKYVGYTWGVDYNKIGNTYYSDRSPGTAYLTIPFYLAGKAIYDMGLNSLLSQSTNIMEVFVIFLPNIAGALAILLIYRLLRLFGLPEKTALLSSAIFAFSTLSWFEATHLQSHVVSMAVALAAVYLAVTMKGFDRRRITALSALLAFSAIIEIQNIAFAPLTIVYLLWSGKVKAKELKDGGNRTDLLIAAAVFVAIYATLVVYNFAAFHELTIKSNEHNPAFPEEQSFWQALSGNPFKGMQMLLVGNTDAIFDWSAGQKNAIPGIFITTPIFLLALAGWPEFIRRHKPEALLFAGMIAIEFAAVAIHTTALTRHITAIYPELFLPAAYIVDSALRNAKKGAYWQAAVIAVLALLSAARVFYSMNTYWSRSLAYPFPFIEEIPSYILMLAVAYGAYKLVGHRLNIAKL